MTPEAMNVETRLGRITASRAGGTAGNGAKTYKISLPSAWVNDLNATDGRRMVLSYDGKSIVIQPWQEMEEYRDSRLSQGHELISIRYYNGETLCTRIYADRTAKDLRAENETDQIVKTAFGKNELPSWADFEAFLKERCIPQKRSGLREYLEALGLEEYDPLAVIQKTQGRMAEDHQWMEVEIL